MVDGLPRFTGCRRAACPHRDRRLKTARVECAECGDTIVLRVGGAAVRLSELPPPAPKPAPAPVAVASGPRPRRTGNYTLNVGYFDWFMRARGNRHPRDPRGG